MATTPKTPSMHDVFERNKYDLKSSLKKSKSWYTQQVLLLSKQRITPQQLMRENTEDLRARIIPGNLYMFIYDPKLKATLPYYDTFPLVFPYATVPGGGFMGLNMHYLPYPLRIRLLDRLLVFKNNDKMDGTTRIKYSWSLIAGVSKYKMAEPCIKHYLLPHVKTAFKKVDVNDWATAMMLPVERFVKAPKEQVWKDSQANL
jgi:hypothetical protein